MPIFSMSCLGVINKSVSNFSTHELSDSIISDNDATFKLFKFQFFLAKILIRQIFVVPYHHSSNFQAERIVTMKKHTLKCSIKDN